MAGEERYGRGEPLRGELGVEPADQLAGRVLVRRRAAVAGEHVDRERQEALEGQAAGDVLDVRVEAAVLVDHDDRRAPTALAEPHEVAGHRPVRARPARPLDREPWIVGRDRGGPGVVVAQDREERGRGCEPAGAARELLHEAPPVEEPVGEPVVQIDDRLLDLHPPASSPKPSTR